MRGRSPGAEPTRRAEPRERWPGVDPIPRTSTASIITERLRKGIAAGEFEPGAQLLEASLASAFDVSRGPVREAIQRLIQEGLLESRPHRGVFVVELTLEDVLDIYLARSAVEREAAVRVIHRNPDGFSDGMLAHLEKMAAAAGTGDWAEIVDLDLRFHELIVDAAASPRLTRMFSTLCAETRLCLSRLAGGYPRPDDLVDEHRELLEFILKGNEQGFVVSLQSHFDTAMEVLARSVGP